MPWYAWVVLVAAGLVALVPGGMGLVLGGMLLDSVSNSDRRVGVVMILVCLAWLALPVLAWWLWSHGYPAWGTGVAVGVVVVGVALVPLAAGAIGAAAQP